MEQWLIGFVTSGLWIAGFGWLLKRSVDAKIKLETEKQLAAAKHELSKDIHQFEQRWEIKRKACLDAMNVVDAFFSHSQWSNIKDNISVKQKLNTIKARSCANRLAVVCDSAEVYRLYLKWSLRGVS